MTSFVGCSELVGAVDALIHMHVGAMAAAMLQAGAGVRATGAMASTWASMPQFPARCTPHSSLPVIRISAWLRVRLV